MLTHSPQPMFIMYICFKIINSTVESIILSYQDKESNDIKETLETHRSQLLLSIDRLDE